MSNQGAEPVYFDNLAVNVTPGVLLEEKHYYPYGLPIQGWGNVATGPLPNRQRHQGNEYREEAGLNWMDFHNRQYDPQLGRFLAVDALADAGGQQVLSPYHAMGSNPALMVDPFGLQSGKSDPRPPGSLLTGGSVPGSSGWGAITGYYKSMLGPASMRPPELQGVLGIMAMMRILSGDAAGSASRMSPGGGSAMSSYEQMVQIDGIQRQWRRYANNRSENQKNILDAFSQLVYNLNNGYDIFDDQGNLIRTVLDGQVVLGFAIPIPIIFPGALPYPGVAPELPSWEGTKNWIKENPWIISGIPYVIEKIWNVFSNSDDEEKLSDMRKNPPNHPDYKAPKSGTQKVKNPNGSGSGWPDKGGDVWVPTNHKGTHSPHWDVQHKNGKHTNVYPID